LTLSPLLALPGIAGKAAIMAAIGYGKRTLASLPRHRGRFKALGLGRCPMAEVPWL
jgi:hypothetical protein